MDGWAYKSHDFDVGDQGLSSAPPVFLSLGYLDKARERLCFWLNTESVLVSTGAETEGKTREICGQ